MLLPPAAIDEGSGPPVRGHRAGGPADWFVRRAGLARWTTILCAAGLSLAAVAGARPAVAFGGLIAALTGTIGSVAFRSLRRSSWVLLPSVLLVGLFAGYLGGSLRVDSLERSSLESHIGESVRAEMVISGQVRGNAGWQSATATVLGPGLNDAGETVLLEVAPARGSGTSAMEAGVGSPPLAQGMIVDFTGAIAAPQGPSASGYDQAEQLRRQGIEVVFRGEGAGSVVVLGRRGGVAGWFDGVRESARDHLARGPDCRVDEAVKGVVLGESAGIEESWLEAFRRSGTAHMLSVSGLHVGSIAAIMLGLCRLLGAARWVGFVAAGASALLMVPFVGASPPIVRAAVMILVVLSGRWLGRGRDQWQVLALAAVVILALNPFALFDVGFQLSFSAFAGMLALTSRLQRALKRLPASVAGNVAVSIAASIGTAPVSLVTFGRASLVSPIANLLVVPLLPVITGAGMASVLLGFVWTGFSTALDTLASIPMMWTVVVSKATAVAPVLDAAGAGRALAALVAGAAALPAALALVGRSVRTPFGIPLPFFRRSLGWLRRHRPRRRRPAAALAVLVVVCGLLLGAAGLPVAARGVEALHVLVGGRDWPDRVEVRVLDVGQGNAVLVRTPERHAVLFDGGPVGCDLAGQLHDLGVSRLDLVVISHPHADHFAGLAEAIDDLQVDTLIDAVEVIPVGQPAGPPGAWSGVAGGTGDEAAAYLDLRRSAIAKGCSYVLAGTGYTAQVDGVAIKFYAPARPLVLMDGPEPWAARGATPTGDQLNGASLVAVASVGSVDVLIPGDAEADVLGRYGLDPAEIVIVPHHGSRGALSTGLLARVQADLAVVSVGDGNPFGHPDASTISLLADEGVPTVRTDTAGWVCCRLDGDTVVMTTERTP